MFSDFRVLDFWPIFCSVFGFVRPRKMILQISATFFQGCQKTGENKGFCGVVPRAFLILFVIFSFIFFHVVSLCSSSLHVPSSLQMSDPSLAVLLVPFVFFLLSVMFFFSFGGGGGMYMGKMGVDLSFSPCFAC